MDTLPSHNQLLRQHNNQPGVGASCRQGKLSSTFHLLPLSHKGNNLHLCFVSEGVLGDRSRFEALPSLLVVRVLFRHRHPRIHSLRFLPSQFHR